MGYVGYHGEAVTSDQIRYWLENGQVFVYSAANGLVTATNPTLTVVGLSIFNPATNTKNIYLFSLIEFGSAGGTPLQATTADPSGTTGFTGTGMVKSNAKLGNATSSIASLSTSPSGITANVALPGTFFSIIGAVNIGSELLTNGKCIIITPGNGIVLAQFVAAAGGGFGAVAAAAEF